MAGINIGLRNLNGYEIQRTMQKIFDTVYGIYNHHVNESKPEKLQDPLARIRWRPALDITTGGSLEESMLDYADLPIWDIFKVNYVDFMRLPSNVVMLMKKQALIYKTKKEQHEAELAKQLSEQNRAGLVLPKQMKQKK